MRYLLQCFLRKIQTSNSLTRYRSAIGHVQFPSIQFTCQLESRWNERLVGRLFSIIHHIAWAKKTIQILLLLLKVKHYTICGTASVIGKIRWLMKVLHWAILEILATLAILPIQSQQIGGARCSSFGLRAYFCAHTHQLAVNFSISQLQTVQNVQTAYYLSVKSGYYFNPGFPKQK